MSPKYTVGPLLAGSLMYHLLTLARSGAEPFTLAISSMPIFTSFLPGFSLIGTTTRVW